MNEEIKLMLSEEEARIKARALLKMPPEDLITKYMFQEQLITNLQKENKKLKETNEEHRKINGDLRKENQKLVKVIDELEKSINKEIERTNNLILENGSMVEINNIRRMLNEDRQCWLYKLTELKGDKDVEN